MNELNIQKALTGLQTAEPNMGDSFIQNAQVNDMGAGVDGSVDLPAQPVGTSQGDDGKDELNSLDEMRKPSWKKTPTLVELRQDLEAAKHEQTTQIAKINRWNELSQVKGSAKPKEVKGRSSVQPKLIRRQAEWRYSALTEPFLGSDKLFEVEPRTFEDAQGANQNEIIINWQFETKLNKVKFIDDFVRATVDEGTSIVRLGWKRATLDIDVDVPIWSHQMITDEETLKAFTEALEHSVTNPREFEETATESVKAAVAYYEESGQPTIAVQQGTTKAKSKKVIENRPTVEVKNPANIYIDPSCGGDIDKALFIVESFETTKADLIKEGRYKDLDKVNWESNTPLTNPDHQTPTPNALAISDSIRKRVVAYEYWGYYDINDDGVLQPIVITWIGDVIIRMEDNPFPDGKLPYVIVPYLPIKREIYGEPDAELLEDNQKILGAITRGMIDLMGRSANAQQGFAKGMLDPLNRRKFDNGQDYEFNPNQHPNNGIVDHKYPDIPQSAMLMLNLQNNEAESLTGVKSFAGGMSGNAYGDVASGIRGILDAASKREMAILRRLALGMTQIGRKIIAMNSEFLSEKEVVRITNEEFITVKREDLKGNYDLKVDISTAEVDDAKAKDLAFILQTTGNTIDMQLTVYILSEIARLKRMPVLADKLLNFKPEPNPFQEQMQQIELEKAKLELEKLKSEAELNKAKAKEASSRADNLDLDFVETETGTKHAREIQKQKAQARGNQDLQIVKSLVATRKEGEREPDIEAGIGFNELSDKLSEQDDRTTAKDVIPQQSEQMPIDNGEYLPEEYPQEEINIDNSQEY